MNKKQFFTTATVLGFSLTVLGLLMRSMHLPGASLILLAGLPIGGIGMFLMLRSEDYTEDAAEESDDILDDTK